MLVTRKAEESAKGSSAANFANFLFLSQWTLEFVHCSQRNGCADAEDTNHGDMVESQQRCLPRGVQPAIRGMIFYHSNPTRLINDTKIEGMR